MTNLPVKQRRMMMVAAGVVSLAALWAASTWIGRTVGHDDGNRAIARIQLVWPSILTMPVQDRALIAGLGMTCRVQDRPPVASAVISCLQDAAADPDAILPKGMSRSAAQARLNALLPRSVKT
ncbi:hypothetical protein [Burkholderia pseudomultivorans]|uniref:Uncharacterized protein n=1 Tax=Burkholderia pseudomultivorans TaxID=1207504 RepID=A0A132EMM9_9BURK|nr:hypothetical protein [Burkholderia pseudomultivorans]KWF37424.1 hypothetical protein WT56_34355 [Burkholderia pseudomultivorans]